MTGCECESERMWKALKLLRIAGLWTEIQTPLLWIFSFHCFMNSLKLPMLHPVAGLCYCDSSKILLRGLIWASRDSYWGTVWINNNFLNRV